MGEFENFTELNEQNLRVTLDSVIDLSQVQQLDENANTVIIDQRSNNESIESVVTPFDFKSLYKSPEFQDKKRKFEVELMDLIRLTDAEEVVDSPADLAFSDFYEEYGVAATETLNSLIVKNIHKPTVLVELLKVLSNVEYEKIYSFGQSLIIGIIGLYKQKEHTEITDLVIRCIENWRNDDFISVLENIESKTGFLRLYKQKVLAQLVK